MSTMLTSHSLRTMILIVGVLFVGLGMYTAFQGQVVEADDSSWTCPLKDHEYFLLQLNLLNSMATSNVQTVYTNCGECNYSQELTPHQSVLYVEEWYRMEDFDHKWPSQYWEPCHIHAGTSIENYWRIQDCAG